MTRDELLAHVAAVEAEGSRDRGWVYTAAALRALVDHVLPIQPAVPKPAPPSPPIPPKAA
jgi:hypothetical protein